MEENVKAFVYKLQNSIRFFYLAWCDASNNLNGTDFSHRKTIKNDSSPAIQHHEGIFFAGMATDFAQNLHGSLFR